MRTAKWFRKGKSIARNYARMMDGDITVESAEGKGTVFTVTAKLDFDRRKKARKERTENISFEGKRILLVEDHPLNVIVAKGLLEKKQFEVVTAENGKKAVELVTDAPEYYFDAILMDIRMPVLDGIEAAYKTINWESVVLIAAMLPMSLALEKTGASEYISNSLVSGLGGYGPLALMAGIYFTTSLMTRFISNTATAVLLAPIAMQSALQIGVSPYPFLFAVAVGASMCFASPFSTPPNALVMPAGQYTFMDYVKVGLPLQIIMGIVMIFILPLLFPF